MGPLLFIRFVYDLVNNFQFARVLIYADDVKLYSIINSPADASKLQSDFDCVVSWSKINNINLNVNKCKVISFGKVNGIIDFDYQIGNNLLNSISDLGVTFKTSFEFKLYLDSTVSKAYNSRFFNANYSRFYQC